MVPQCALVIKAIPGPWQTPPEASPATPPLPPQATASATGRQPCLAPVQPGGLNRISKSRSEEESNQVNVMQQNNTRAGLHRKQRLQRRLDVALALA
jgi:hypothetical protein